MLIKFPMLSAALALTLVAAGPGRAAAQDRAADRAAIRAHIESIFKAYVERDCETIRATHARDWIGFTGQARSILRGIDAYMNSTAAFCRQKDGAARAPAAADGGLVDYKITEIDYVFYGDTALVPYVAETWYGRQARAPGKLRSIDIYAKLNGEWTQVGSNIYLHPDALALRMTEPAPIPPQLRKWILEEREAVWRAWFGNDQAKLEKMIPPDALAINAGEEAWADRAAILEGAKQFAKGGGKLVRLEFPRTEMRVYGSTVIIYTQYLYETEGGGKRSTHAGRATEHFVIRDGRLVNTGWLLDDGK